MDSHIIYELNSKVMDTILILGIIAVALSTTYSIRTFINSHENAINTLKKELLTEIQERDKLVNRRIDGEIDRVNNITHQYEMLYYKLQEKLEDKLDTTQIEALEVEVDRLSHVISEIEVSLQNEINRLK